MKKRRTFTPEQKTKIVLELLSEEHTLTEVAAKYEIQPAQITRWKSEFLKNASRVFSKEKDESDELKQKHASEIDELHRQLGQLTVEVNWLKKNLKKLVCPQNRRKLVEKSNPKLSIVKQCKLLELNRSTLYYKPKPVDRTEEYKVKWIIDQLYTAPPTYGYRTMTTVLRRDFGIKINKKRTRRYMRDMAIHGLCTETNLSKREHAKYVYPYLLRKIHIDRPNQVWSIDITYLRMPKGHMYLCAIIDWHSRFIVSYELSTTMDKAFVLNTVRKAIQAYRKPEIINSDQGAQFTCDAYTQLLKDNKIKISMDGRGKALDNIRITTIIPDRISHLINVHLDKSTTTLLL